MFCFCLLTDLEQDGFSKNPFFHGIIAEVPEQHRSKDGEENVYPLTSISECMSSHRSLCSNVVKQNDRA